MTTDPPRLAWLTSRFSLPLRTRIAVLSAGCVALAVVAITVTAYYFFEREMYRQLDLGLTREMSQIKLRAKANNPDFTTAGECTWLAEPACRQVVRTDPASVSDQDLFLPVDDQVLAVAAGTEPEFRTNAVVRGLPLRIVTTPLEKGTALQVAVRSDGVVQSLDRIRFILVTAGLGVTAGACLLGYLAARASMRPVARIAATSRQIATTADPHLRIDVRGTDELAQLAADFNAMLAVLEESLTAQRRLIADASHELRTPITSLRSDIDLLTDSGQLSPEQHGRITTRIHDQFAELTQLVTDLIELARGDEPDESVDEIQLHDLVTHALRDAERHWPDITFRVDLEPTLVDGTSERLTRAVANLFDNAAKFSTTEFGPVDGIVTVRLREKTLTVHNHGPSIPPDALPHVFDRFYRAPTARTVPGSGLGLAIVAQVAHQHGATVTASSAPETGTIVTLTFPDS